VERVRRDFSSGNYFQRTGRTDPDDFQGSVCMLKDAETFQHSNADDEAREKLNDAEALFTRLKAQVMADYNSKGQVNWRREAREDFRL
jgi:hypothetical protein